MSEKPTYPFPLLILALDRLIKERFRYKLKDYLKKDQITNKRIYEIKEQITKHDVQLTKNLYLDSKQAKTGNRKLQFITMLYGIKKYKPDSEHVGQNNWEGISIQSFINEKFPQNTSVNEWGLSKYFYDKLNNYIIECQGIINAKMPKFNNDKLLKLFEIAIPNEVINDWDSFATHSNTIKVLDALKQELKEEEESFQDFFTFNASYYSRTRKKIHNFEVRFSKEYSKVGGSNLGKAIVSFKEGKLYYEGTVERKSDKVTATLYKKDSDKRVIILAFVPQAAQFGEVNFIHGIYIGDSVKEEGKIFSMEFIACKPEFADSLENNLRIISALLLKRNNFEIKSYDLTIKKLDMEFLASNNINDNLKSIIERIKTHQVVFFNYGKSGSILLSKISFDERFQITLISPFPVINGSRKIKQVEQACNLSATNKGRKIIATTYAEGHFNNVVVIDFKEPREQVFTGALSYHGDKETYANYIVAVIDPNNKNQNAKELKAEDIKTLEEIKVYKAALKTLKVLRDKNLRYITRSKELNENSISDFER